MASLYVTEYAGIGHVDPGYDGMSYLIPAQAPKGPPLADQKITITGSSAQTAAFNRYTKMIRVHVDVVCSVFIGGTNPAATTGNGRMAANQTEYFCVTPGDKVAVIANT